MTTTRTRSEPLSQNMIVLALVLLMAATRISWIHTFIPLPGASTAVFFLCGAYVRSSRVFILLALEAIAIDLSYGFTTGDFWCISPSYPFLLVGYACLWGGGRWFAKRSESGLQQVLLLAGIALAASTVHFTLSNGGFYWFSGRYPEPNWSEYVARYAQYFGGYVTTTVLYVLALPGLVVGASYLWRRLPMLRNA